MPPRKQPSQTRSRSHVITPSLPSTQLRNLRVSLQSQSPLASQSSQAVLGVGRDGTPPPEQGWWENTSKEWDNDAKPGGKSTYQLLLEYFDDPRNLDYWNGAGGGSAKKGAKACRRWLYEQRAPSRRSARAIGMKYRMIKEKWKKAEEFRYRTGSGRGMTLIEDAPDGQRETIIDEVDANRLCPDFKEWHAIFKGRTAGDPRQQAPNDAENDRSTELLGQMVGYEPSPLPDDSPSFPDPTQRSPSPYASVSRALGLGSSFGDDFNTDDTPEDFGPSSSNMETQSFNPNDLVAQSLRDRATVNQAQEHFDSQESEFLDQQLQFARDITQSQQEQTRIRAQANASTQKYQEKKLELAERDIELRRKADIMKSATKMVETGRVAWNEALEEAKRAYDML
ncbi:hypothetical protein V866_001507 [Kwoniella sp. B9012]